MLLSLIDQLLDMPWRPFNTIRRLISFPYIRIIFFLNGVKWGKRWRIYGTPILQRHRKSVFELGDGLEMRSWASSNPLTPNHRVSLSTRQSDAILKLGHFCGLTGATVVSAERVEIGDRVLIGANTIIADTDFHPITPDGRKQDILAGEHKPIVIEDDVFIGMNCLILKGVSIGRGSVIGAGSVVTKDVPSGVVVAGNPARVIRALG